MVRRARRRLTLTGRPLSGLPGLRSLRLSAAAGPLPAVCLLVGLSDGTPTGASGLRLLGLELLLAALLARLPLHPLLLGAGSGGLIAGRTRSIGRSVRAGLHRLRPAVRLRAAPGLLAGLSAVALSAAAFGRLSRSLLVLSRLPVRELFRLAV